MVHSRKLPAKDRAKFQALYPTESAAALAAEEKLKAFFQAGALRGITVYGKLPPRTRPAPVGISEKGVA